MAQHRFRQNDISVKDSFLSGKTAQSSVGDVTTFALLLKKCRLTIFPAVRKFRAPSHRSPRVSSTWIRTGLLSGEQREKLKDIGILDDVGNVVADPRSRPWKQGIFGRLSREEQGNEITTPKVSQIRGVEEVLNRCWAQHEFAPDYAGEVADFVLQALGAHGQVDKTELAQQKHAEDSGVAGPTSGDLGPKKTPAEANNPNNPGNSGTACIGNAVGLPTRVNTMRGVPLGTVWRGKKPNSH